MNERISLKDILDVSSSSSGKESRYTTDELLFYQAVVLQAMAGAGPGEMPMPPKCRNLGGKHEHCPLMVSHDRNQHQINWKCTYCKRQGTITGLQKAVSSALTNYPEQASSMDFGNSDDPRDEKESKGINGEKAGKGDAISGTDYPADCYPQIMPMVYLTEEEYQWLKTNLKHPDIAFEDFWEMSGTRDEFIFFPLPFLFCALAIGILSNKTWRKKSDKEYVESVSSEISAAAGVWFKDILHARSSQILKNKDYRYFFSGVQELDQLYKEMDQIIRTIRSQAAKRNRSFSDTMEQMLGERGPWEYLIWPDELPENDDSDEREDLYMDDFNEANGFLNDGDEDPGLDDWDDEFPDEMWDEFEAFHDEMMDHEEGPESSRRKATSDPGDEWSDEDIAVPHEFMMGMPPPVFSEKAHHEQWRQWIRPDKLAPEVIDSTPFIRNIRLLFGMLEQEGGKLPLTQTGRFRVKDVRKLLDDGHWPPGAHDWLLDYYSGKTVTEDKFRFLEVFREMMLTVSLVRKRHNKLLPVKKMSDCYSRVGKPSFMGMFFMGCCRFMICRLHLVVSTPVHFSTICRRHYAMCKKKSHNGFPAAVSTRNFVIRAL